MATTSAQDRSFIGAIFPNTLLEDTIEWIQGNIAPEDVFGNRDLDDWAKREASSNLEPDDIFDDSELERWAEANGYTKEGETNE